MISIVIPTRARQERVYKQIETVNKQLSKLNLTIELELLIVENNSSHLLSAQKIKRAGWAIKTEPADLGGNHNFCNSIISAQMDYVWVLGDDDILKPNSVDKVVQFIQKYEADCLIVNKLGLIKGNTKPKTQRDLFDQIPELGPLIHISGYVVKRKAFLECCSDSILYQSTFLPQLIYALNAQQRQSLYLIEEEIFIEKKIENKLITELYFVSTLVVIGLKNIEIFIESKALKSWFNLIKNTRRNWLTPKGIMYELANYFASNRTLRLRFYNQTISINHQGLLRFIFFKCIGNAVLRSDFLSCKFVNLYEYFRGFSINFRPSLKYYHALYLKDREEELNEK